MNIIEIIDRKKKGKVLTGDEIAYFVKGASDKTIPDYQISALLMAILLKGMNDRETYHLTKCMAESGEMEDLSDIQGSIVDKHSTGGVGDSTTFVIMPIVAALGLKVAKMSGRALGHTGGTIDKLESIPGFRTELSSEEFYNNVNKAGISIIGQTGNICPADKKLYAIRDVTATVDSIPLIASSIMSKKLAGGAQTIVLDVKCGSGAFMQETEDAKALARAMVDIGKLAGRNIKAVVTDMNEPLDQCIGNRLEILGAVRVLKGEKNRLAEVSIIIAALILESALQISHEEGISRVNDCIASGKAYEKFLEFIRIQGGDIKYIEEIEKETLPSFEVRCDTTGYLFAVDTRKIGNILVMLGGGRMKLGDSINYDVGLVINKRIGDYVKKNDSLAKIYYKDDKDKELSAEILSAFTISPKPPEKRPLIVDIIE